MRYYIFGRGLILHSFTLLSVSPLEVRVFSNAFSDGVELSFLIFLFPEGEDIFLNFSKVRVGVLEVLEPGRKFGEHFLLMEDHGPAEGTGEHVLDETAGGEPGHVRVANLITGQVRAADHGVLEPGELLVNLSDLGSSILGL